MTHAFHERRASHLNVSGLKGWEGHLARFKFTATIGSGSSGGAILDESGNLVGITSSSLAHGNLRDRGAISENVNFGIKVSLVHEMLAASGIDIPPQNLSHRSEKHTSELQSLMRISYAVFCLKKTTTR